jgi:hypothetical protein
MLDTGFPQADVENDFLRARRHQVLAAAAHRLHGQRGRDRLARLDQVVGRLGWCGQRQLGLRWRNGAASPSRLSRSTG